ncbi:XRE family transcriptional regulator [Pseudomonas oryzihabitans]|uniref:DNA-binding protein n=1 Tax=Pseudomonas oryzihabitans TaxID=47885 RepID=A0A2Z5A8B6_9PSED|nr:XRE family transcriptional regulator [Pseudomonas oryzihabitans]AXA66714.1 DNA-binding protein [Pseudomonas oryzihabitans]
MSLVFDGASLRLARVFNAMTLDEVAEKVGKTRQYINKIETGQSHPTEQLAHDIAHALNVMPSFFSPRSGRIHEDQFHFRKLLTTTKTIKQVAVARGEIANALIGFLEHELNLPSIRIPSTSDFHTPDSIERLADSCRRNWELGLGPIQNMTRLAENLGVMVLSFNGISKEIDALSVATKRPFIVRNSTKESTGRHRFDIAHELGHLVMHEGIVTGDRVTENQANRFASSLILPRAMMEKFFPKPKGTRLDWIGIREFKKTWGASKAAILYRARQLELINDSQYRTGVITLKKHEGTHEKDDFLIPNEPPELLPASISLLSKKRGIGVREIAEALNVKPEFLKNIFDPDVFQDNREIQKPNHLRLVI